MGGGSKTQTTTSNQTRDPWGPAVPAVTEALTGALNTYRSGVGSQVYQGDRTAGLGDVTQAGLSAMQSGALAGTGAAQAGNTYLTGLLGNGGATAATQSALGGLMSVRGVNTGGVASAAARMADPNNAASTVGRSLTGGAYNLDATGYNDILSGLGTGTQTGRSLQDVADGKFLSGSNPYLNDIIGQGQNDATSAVAQKMAASGRYGSGRFASAVADAADRVGTQARYADYDAERARQASAASAIDSSANARAGVSSGLLDAINGTRTANANQAVTGANLSSGADAAALGGAQALASLQAANNQQRLSQFGTALSAGQADRASAQQGLAQIAAVQQGLVQPGQVQTSVGAIQDAARQQELDAARDVFDEQQAAPWKQVGLLSSVAMPAAGLGGTQTGTETRTVPQPSFLQSLLGGLSTGVGLLGQTGAFPSAAKGAASAGWLSALPALFSDERLKEDVKEVGELHDGQTIYSYRYKGDDTPQIGLLAQEVQKKRPSAVSQAANGFLAVDYGRATAGAARMAAGGRR